MIKDNIKNFIIRYKSIYIKLYVCGDSNYKHQWRKILKVYEKNLLGKYFPLRKNQSIYVNILKTR
jgi:hypothetical protein